MDVYVLHHAVFRTSVMTILSRSLQFHTSFHVMNFTSDRPLNHLPQAQEVPIQILSVTKTYSPILLVVFCTVNIMAAILSVSGIALVFLTVVSFLELHITPAHWPSEFGDGELLRGNLDTRYIRCHECSYTSRRLSFFRFHSRCRRFFGPRICAQCTAESDLSDN